MLAELGVVEQRYRAVLEVLEEGVSVTEAARRHQVARQTVHEWLARYAAGGLGGLADRSSRPASCPHQMPAVVEARIVSMRRDHPGWGPSRIRWELERAGMVPLPGRSAVYRALIRHGLVDPKKRRRRREDYRRWERGRAMDQIAFCDERIGQLTARITGSVAAMPGAWGIDGDGTTGPDAGTGPDAAVLPAVARLAEIPGISPGLARAIIAETGLDMSRFPDAAHLVSWAGLCPSARQSGPRTRAGKKGQGNRYLRGSLGQAAIGVARTPTFPGERYHRIARRRGKARA